MKNDCDACGPELGAYLLGESSDEARREVDAHLAACTACRDELERERALRTALGDLPTATCPGAVTARILAVVDAEYAATRRRNRRLRGVGLAGGLLAATLAAVLFLRPGAALRGASAEHYTPEQVATARHELIQTLTLTARVLDQAGRSTLVDVFNDQLPSAVEGSLRPLDDPTRGG
jgi:anti-sigma factor RsiW